MAQPLYFLSGVSRDALGCNPLTPAKLNRNLLAEHGIAGTFADVRENEIYCGEINSGGPDEKGGAILTYQTPAGKLPRLTQIDPKQQTWTKCGERLWIGVDNANPPTADDLRRHKLVPGYLVEAVGGDWQVPVIRRSDDTTELPRDMYFNGDGVTLHEPVKQAYRQYWDDSAEVANWFYVAGWRDANKPKALRLAVNALSINYRFGLLEQSVLRVIDSENYLTVLMMTVDVPAARAIEAAQKKTASTLEEQSITPGQPEG